MFSFGGKAGDALLREGFAALHTHRAQKYGLTRRPDDYTTARAELHGAFVRPTGVETIEFINPSVQDWLNRVVRTEPDNAIDLIVGSVRFTQIAQVWSFVQSAVGGATRETLRRDLALVAPQISVLATAQRTIPHEKGVAYIAPPYEERLATMIRMADALRAPALLPVIAGIIARIKEERSETLCEIDKTISAVKAFESAGWEELQRFDSFFENCAGELVTSAEHGCGSGELRALLEQYEDGQTPGHPFKDALKAAFEKFLGSYLSDEIRNCRSEQDFDSLIDHLEYFGRTFAFDLDNQIASTNEARDEYVDYEERRADQHMDEYKEYMREERANEDGIREMFGSLRQDD